MITTKQNFVLHCQWFSIFIIKKKKKKLKIIKKNKKFFFYQNKSFNVKLLNKGNLLKRYEL